MLVLNGFGLSLGDSLIGLQALAAARELGAVTGPVRLVRGPGLHPLVDQLYGLVAFAEIERGDPSVPGLYDGRVVDLRDLAFDPAFRGVAMIDFFLAKLGLAPAWVPARLRRNAWLAPMVEGTRGQGGYVLICPRSSMALRDWPDSVHRAVVAAVLRATTADVLTQGPWTGEPPPRLQLAPQVPTIGALCALVAGASAIISTDTAMVHLADAFGVPCAAVFTTHRPEWRVRDYPLCHAMRVVADGVPDGLEFIRGPADLAAMRAAWREVLARPGWAEDVIRPVLGG
jgi:hypothetical protein